MIRLNVSVSGALVLALVLVGCGNSSSTSRSSSTKSTSAGGSPSGTQSTSAGTQTSSTPNEGQAPAKEEPPKGAVVVSSPAFQAEGPIPAQYTCDGADTSPPVSWSGIPPGTVELVLLIANFNEKTPDKKPSIYWAVAGLPPTSNGISAGALPRGAIVGRNSAGQRRYSICPPKGRGVQNYVVILYALQRHVSAKPGFAAFPLGQAVSNIAEHKGLTNFTYERG